MSRYSSGLGSAFRLFWAGQTANGLGSMVSTVALPLVAVQLLHATTFDVGLLEAVEWLPAVLIGLPAGALVDRHQHRCRAIMMAANVGQAAATASVPIAAVTGALSLPVLLAAASATGLLGVFFQAGYAPYLRQLLPPDDLAAGNSRLQAGRSAAQVGGPALGGALAASVGAATTLLADAASFLVSFASLCLATTSKSIPRPARQPLLGGIAEGLRHLQKSPILLTITVATATANLFLTAMGAIEIVFLVRAVGVPARDVGALITIGGVGGLLGAASAGKLTRRYGLRRLANTALAFTAPAALLLPLAHRDATLALFAVGGLVASFGISVASIALLTLRLQLCPPALQGRISASSRLLNSATIPAGALLGGGLGQLFGTRLALTLMATGYTLFALALTKSPLATPIPALDEITAGSPPVAR